MSFWIKVDVDEKGEVVATTFDVSITGEPRNSIRKRSASTVSQVLRKLAAAMVTAKAETVEKQAGAA